MTSELKVQVDIWYLVSFVHPWKLLRGVPSNKKTYSRTLPIDHHFFVVSAKRPYILLKPRPLSHTANGHILKSQAVLSPLYG